MGNIKPSYIPNRLRNVSAEHPYVAGAIDIYDDAKGENQQSINADVDNTLALHQSEINALNSQNYVTVDTYAELPEEGSADTVYRVVNWDGTQVVTNTYAEYAWNGSQYKLLDVKNPGIDDVPTAGSGNLVKSGGVFSKTSLSSILSNNLCNTFERGRYIKDDGEIGNADNTYRLARFYIKTSKKYLVDCLYGNTHPRLAKWANGDYSGTGTIILQNGNGFTNYEMLLDEGYYALCWSSSQELSNYEAIVADMDIVNEEVRIVIEPEIQDANGRAAELGSEIPMYKYGTNYYVRWTDGELIKANNDYKTVTISVKEGDRIKYINLQASSSVAIISAYNNGTYIQSFSIQGNMTYLTGIYTVPSGVNKIRITCGVYSIEGKLKILNAPISELEYDNGIIKRNIFDAYTDFSNGIYGHIKYADGVIVPHIDHDYTYYIFNVKEGDKIRYIDIWAPNNIVALIAAYKDGIYSQSDSLCSVNSVRYSGVYAVPSGVTTVLVCTANSTQYKYAWVDNGLKLDVINSEKKSFSSVDQKELSFTGTASIIDNIVKIGGGASNKAYLPVALQTWHSRTSVSFKCTGTPNFVIGNDDTNYGVSVKFEGNTLTITKEGAEQAPVEIGFTLQQNVEYAVSLIRDIDQNKFLKIEIFDNYGNSFSYTTNYTVHAYGRIFMYSSSESCDVYAFSFTSQHYYTPNKTRLIVVGHSFVEADSLGSDRIYCFTKLLENYNGEGSVANCGLGGDTAAGMDAKLRYFETLHPNAEYVMSCIGSNDASVATDVYVKELYSFINLCTLFGKKPILSTIPPRSTGYPSGSHFEEINAWIRESGYAYYDVDKVFFNQDGTINTSLFLNDGLHPNVEGHQRIYNRIKMDCPYLF